MICFTLPSFDVVFKVIRDRFAYPKNILREEVLKKYELVFKHDRAGRLVDAQEFKRLQFPTDALLGRADRGAEERGRQHRALRGRRAGHRPRVHRAAHDAAQPVHPQRFAARTPSAPCSTTASASATWPCTNIFAGDLLLKNFGVTRHGRVIFYDYDELCAVTDCRFRDMPQAQSDEDEMRAEAWFHVNENDVFPETFMQFLGFDAEPEGSVPRECTARS